MLRSQSNWELSVMPDAHCSSNLYILHHVSCEFMCEKRFMVQNSCALHAIDEFFTPNWCGSGKVCLCVRVFWVKWRWKCAWKCRSNNLIDLVGRRLEITIKAHSVIMFGYGITSTAAINKWLHDVWVFCCCCWAAKSLAQLHLSRLSMQFWHEVGDCLMKWYLNYNTPWRTWSLIGHTHNSTNSFQFRVIQTTKKTGSVIKSVKLFECRYFVHHQQLNSG